MVLDIQGDRGFFPTLLLSAEALQKCLGPGKLPLTVKNVVLQALAMPLGLLEPALERLELQDDLAELGLLLG